MRGGGEVGKGHVDRRQPVAGAHQPANIGEMIADIVAGRAQRIGVGRAAALLAASCAA